MCYYKCLEGWCHKGFVRTETRAIVKRQYSLKLAQDGSREIGRESDLTSPQYDPFSFFFSYKGTKEHCGESFQSFGN